MMARTERTRGRSRPGLVGLRLLAGSILIAAAAPGAAAQGEQAWEPLEARLYEPIGSQLQFSVSRPAYVAVFEIVPGSEMRMLHPWTSYGVQRAVSTGSHSFFPQRTTFNRNLYSLAGYSRYSSPIVLLLIASERPLQLEGLPRSPTALLNYVGFSSYHPASTFDAVVRLADRIVPDADYTDWTYDSYIIWPEPQLPVLAMHPVVCADGQVRFIVGGRLPAGCLKASAARPSSDTARTPRDSTRKDRPRRSTRKATDLDGDGPSVIRGRVPEAATGSATRKAGERRGGASEGRSATATRRPQRTTEPARTSGSGGGARKEPAAERPRPSPSPPSPQPAPTPSSGSDGKRSSGAAVVPHS